MSEPRTQLEQQLQELLADPDVAKLIALATREVMCWWGVEYRAARGFVLSAIGEPKALACIHQAWSTAKEAGGNLGLPKVIIRRRVIDLLGKEKRSAQTDSWSQTTDELEVDPAVSPFSTELQRNPQVELEYRQLIARVRVAVESFAAQSVMRRRQAELLRRHYLDEISYAKLSTELGCTENALRVRMFKAMNAFRKHIRERHPELL